MNRQTSKEEELIKAGWEKRFIAGEPRLSEMVQLYKEIGFDVHLEPLPTKEEIDDLQCVDTDCSACYELDRERYKIIFTKKAS